jgi:cathepsin F
MVRRVCVALAVVGVIGQRASSGFHAWMAEHGKHYNSDAEFDHAHKNFVETESQIRELNANPEDTAVYGHNKFSDLSVDEWRSQFLGVAASRDRHQECLGGSTLPIPSGDAPISFDWRDHGAVSPIRDQGGCGSCWAESAIGNMEGQHFLVNKLSTIVPLSTEQILECDEFDTACYGGWPSGAYKSVIEAGGLASHEDYPYRWNGQTICLANQTFNETCGDGMCDDPPLTNWCDISCEAKKHKKVAKIHGWASLSEDEDEMAKILATHGPISVAIDASGGGMGFLFPWLKSYKSGVANPKKCTEDALDHAVLVVGMGEDNGQKYWIIKNSWGSSFGENGFFRLLRGESKCGVNTCASTSIIGPVPPTPAPKPPAPTPVPSDCPGGSLEACLHQCPASPQEDYVACVKDCGIRCPSTTVSV